MRTCKGTCEIAGTERDGDAGIVGSECVTAADWAAESETFAAPPSEFSRFILSAEAELSGSFSFSVGNGALPESFRLTGGVVTAADLALLFFTTADGAGAAGIAAAGAGVWALDGCVLEVCLSKT